MNIKLTILGFADNAVDVMDQILANHGEHYDEGEFTVGIAEAGGRVVVEMLDVAVGDARALANDLYHEVKGVNGDITIRASQQLEGSYFPLDLDDDD